MTKTPAVTVAEPQRPVVRDKVERMFDRTITKSVYLHLYFLLVGGYYDHSLFCLKNAISVLQRYCILSEWLFYFAHAQVITFIGVITLKGDIDFE